MDSSKKNNSSYSQQAGGKVDITASVLTVGFFICLQIQEEDKIVLPYSLVQSTNSRWTDGGSLGLGILSKLMELAREECRKIVTGNTSYCYDTKVIPFSQVIIAPASENLSVTESNTVNEMKSKIKGSELNPRLVYSPTCILPMQNNVLEGLGKALSIKASSNINLSDVMLEVEKVIISSGLHGLKKQLGTYLQKPDINTGNVYLDCMWLIHKICSVRLLMTYASVDDYSSRLLGIVLTVAGLELQCTAPMENSVVILTWNWEEGDNHSWARHDILKMTEAKVICAVYPSSNVNLDEIASSLVPMPFSPIADSIATISKWMMPNPIYKQLRDEYWEISKGTLTQNIEMDFLSWAVETSRNRDVLYLLLLSLVIKRCMQLDIFYMHWKSKLSSDLCMKLTVEEERRLLLDDAHSLGLIHRYPLESFRPNTFTLSPLKGQAQSYIKFMTCVLSLLDPTADKGHISDDIHSLVGENGDIAEKDHKQFWKDNGLSFPRKIAFKHCTQLTVDRISFLLKELQMNINASLLLFEFVFHGTPLSHQEISNIIAIDNHVIEDKESPLLSVRTKCKVCYCHAMDTATTFFSKSVHVMRFVVKEKLNKSNLTDQEKARVTALVNFKVDEYLPAAIARLLFDKLNLEKINMSNTQVDESMKSSISQWIKVPYMNKCQCDGRPQHGFIRSCLFCGLDAIHTAKNMLLNEKVQSLLFSPRFANDNANSVINEFIDFFYHMISLVIDDKTCSLKPEKKRGKNKGKEHNDPSEPNVNTRDEEHKSASVDEDSKCDKQKISEGVKRAGRFVLDSVEVDGQGCDGEKSSSDIEADETDDQDHETDTVHIDNDSDDNYFDKGNEVDSKAFFRFKNAEAEERRTNKAEARLLKRNNAEQAPVSVAECVPSLTVIQVMEIAKKFDPKGSFSRDLSSFLQWMFSFSTGPSLTIINDFAQHGCNLSSKAVHTQNEGNYVNIVPSLTDIDEIEMSQKHKVTSVKDLDQSVEDVRHHNNCERNGGESLVPPEAIVTTRKKMMVHTKKEDKSSLSVKKARDTSSAKLSDEGKKKLSNATENTIRTRKIKDNDAKDEAATKLPVVKRLKTKENDSRLFAEFFGK